MRVLIMGTRSGGRCYKCGKKIKFGQHYILVTTFPVSRQNLKMDYKLRPQHYPNCPSPREDFGWDGMGKSYIV